MLKDKRYLVLEDGTVYEGYQFGGKADRAGELVFNTSMFGFQEMITDSAYANQIVTFSYPLVGNTGFNSEDSETMKPTIAGIVVREAALLPSNFRTNETLHDYLERHNIPGISGIDTRSIVRKIRDGGTLRAMLSDSYDVDAVIETLKSTDETVHSVRDVSTSSPYISTGVGSRVVLIDLGKQESLVRSLNSAGCEVTVVPHDTPTDDILRMKPDGVIISSGPGSPEDIPSIVDNVRTIAEQVPVFGVGLGHQAIALAFGAKIEALPFGHRGANIPVRNIERKTVEITSQNHGFAVSRESLEQTDLVITHEAINDDSVEGIRHKSLPIMSVQYYPGAIDGPDDSSYILEEFINRMNKENNHA